MVIFAMILGIVFLLLLLLTVLFSAFFVKRRGSMLDKAYHEALHAESVEDFARATQLYETILEKYSNALDEKVRHQIKSRIDTMRYQQDYAKRFEERPVVVKRSSSLRS
jgi:flagellar basal body-associated protein FliL